MEFNIETALRIYSPINVESNGHGSGINSNNSDVLYCVNSNTVLLANSHTYNVNYVLPPKCSQSGVFATSVYPLVNYFFEGCDVSVVSFGQNGTGKTYTLLGPGLNCALSECEQGIIPRFLREVFLRLEENSKNLHSKIYVTWSQICCENVQDLLGAGRVEITNVSDAFQLIQLGMVNLAPRCAHTLFTLTLEQQFLSAENVVSHRISTASFADLCGSEKMLVVDQTGFTQSIPTDPGLLALQRCVIALTEQPHFNCVPFNQSALTTLLKDSFGGRAKTLLLCCVSPLLRDLSETFYTMQFAVRAQLIKNIVTVNSYNTYDVNYTNYSHGMDVFGLQFAANQLFKLVSNAEELFQRLATNGSLSKADMEQISQWLTLKQECEECLSENSEPRRSLDIIQEEEIEDETITSMSSEDEESDAEEETSLMLNNAQQQISMIMEKLEKDTDAMVFSHLEIPNANPKLKEELKKTRGRRTSAVINSISLSVSEISSCDSVNKYDSKKRALKAVIAEMEGYDRQIQELEHTIAIKEKLVQHLLKHRNVKDTAKEKIELKCEQLRSDYQSAKNKAIQAQVQNDQHKGEKLRLEVAEIQEKLKSMLSIKGITTESEHRLSELESSLHTSYKQLENLKKLRKKEEKRKTTIEKQLLKKQKKEDEEIKKTNSNQSLKSSLNLKSLDCSGGDKKLDDETLDRLRHEIRNLRKTREHLLERKSQIDDKKVIKNDLDERKLIQFEEAVEAIDFSIEFKNELLCGRRFENEMDSETDKMLFERLQNLNDDEMRVLLQKYFEKVVDLRTNSKKLEQQVVDLENQNDNLTSRVQSLSHSLQQVRLQSERRIITQQQRHEDELNFVWRHLLSEKPPIGGRGGGKGSLQIQASAAAAIATTKRTTANKKDLLPKELQQTFNQAFNHQHIPQTKVTKQKNKLIIQQKASK